MPEETLYLIRELKLDEPTGDEALQSARALALKYVRSRSPIPRTLMTAVERGAKIGRSILYRAKKELGIRTDGRFWMMD